MLGGWGGSANALYVPSPVGLGQRDTFTFVSCQTDLRALSRRRPDLQGSSKNVCTFLHRDEPEADSPLFDHCEIEAFAIIRDL